MKLLLRLAKKAIRLISLLLLGACAVTALGFGYARDTFNEIKESSPSACNCKQRQRRRSGA